MHQPSQSTRSAGPSSITLPPPPVFSSFTLQGYTPDRSPPTVVESPTLVFKTAPSSPFSEPPSPVSPPTQWYTPPTTPQSDLSDPQSQGVSSLPAEPVPTSVPILVPQVVHKAGVEQLQTNERNEGPDATFPSIIDLAFDSGFDEEGLTTLEKIYLYCRSDFSIHRIFIAHALPSYLEQVTPQEAVEYVLPLIHNLAVDDEEAVKAALATELVPVIWWFFSHCQLISDDLESLESYASTSTMVTISVQAFTPILGTLLLGTSEKIITPARFAILDLLARMRRADSREVGDMLSPASPSRRTQANLAFLSNNLIEDEDEGNGPDVGLFKSEERSMFRQVLLHSVIIGMSRLDMDLDYDNSEGYEEGDFRSQACVAEAEQSSESISKRSSPGQSDNPYFPPLPSQTSSQSSSPSSGPLSSASPSPVEATSSLSIPQAAPSPPTSPPGHPSESATSRGAHGMSSPYSPASPTRLSPPPSPGPEWPEEQSKSPSRLDHEHHQDYDEAYEYLGSDARKAALGRLSSMSLMAAVTATGSLEEEYQRAFVKEIVRAGRDAAYFYVRREASLALGALAKVVPQELVKYSLLPLFDTLRWDPDFRVRQSALFALPAILPRLLPNYRRTVALETAMALSKDQYGIVRVSVLETLGEVLHTFKNDPGGPPQELLELFIGRGKDVDVREGSHWSCYNDLEPQPADQALEFFFTDPERPLICAFNFPAVALTLGSARWPELREFYFELARNKNVHIRKTMAASLGEVARIIGQANAQNDLVPIWWDSLHFDDESVRTKAVEALDTLLPALDRDVGKTLLTGVLESWENGLFRGWRERETVIASLETYLDLVGLGDAGPIVRRLILKGLEDNVAAVRESVRSVLPRIWKHISSDPTLLVGLEADLESLSHSSVFRRRMTYVACMQTRVQHMHDGNLNVGLDAMLKNVARLAEDPVVDVRIAVSRFLSIYHLTYGHRAEDFSRIAESLASDPSHDVKSFLSNLRTTSSSPFALAQKLPSSSPAVPPPNIPHRRSSSSLFSRPPVSPLPSPSGQSVPPLRAEATS